MSRANLVPSSQLGQLAGCRILEIDHSIAAVSVSHQALTSQKRRFDFEFRPPASTAVSTATNGLT